MIWFNEFRSINNIAKKVIHKRLLNKVKKIKDNEEKIKALKYLIKVALQMKVHNLEKRIKKIEKEKKDVFFVLAKLNLLESKMKIFYSTFHKKDFKKVDFLFKNIEKELENDVRII